MASNDWSKKTEELLTGAPGTQISFNDIRKSLGDPNASISAKELYRVTDLDAPYDFSQGKYPTSTGQAHLPYVLDATENASIPTSGAITPDDIRDVIKEYVIEQDANTEEENFNVTSLSSPNTPSITVDWNSNLNKNISKYLRIKGRILSNTVSTPAVIADQASSNLNIYVSNAPPSYGVYSAGGAISQPGGHAISVSNPGAPAIRKVFVECEGSDARIYAGGGGGAPGSDGVDGVDGNTATTGVPGVPGSDANPPFGDSGAFGTAGQVGSDGSAGANGTTGGDGGKGSKGSRGDAGQPGQPGSDGQQRQSFRKRTQSERRRTERSRRKSRKS